MYNSGLPDTPLIVCAPSDASLCTVMACQSIANVVKSSLGPVGLDKMLVDDIGDTTVTNDGATILNLLEVDHPAGKVLVELAQLQVIILYVCCVLAR
jgi:chaperonin GroEL (HSP60 family)